MVKIITDSAADFETYELTNNDIICIPMSISFGKEEYRESEHTLAKTPADISISDNKNRLSENVFRPWHKLTQML